MNKALFYGLMLSLTPLLAIGGPNNTGYAKINEIKVWPTYIDIYSDIEHVCNYVQQRYVLSKDENQMFSIALSAMTAGMAAQSNGVRVNLL